MLNNADHPLISVIVPVHNVEAYLKRCMNSLVRQTYDNLEIILVDDGSTDLSSRICDEYAAQYPNVKAIHQQNKGLCGARNTGLDNAGGEYIGFVDSDDWCAPDMYRYLYDNLSKYGADVAACGYYRESEEGWVITGCDGADHVLDKSLLIPDIVLNNDFSTFFWNKLFRKEVLASFRFPEGRTFEGICSMHKALMNAEKAILAGDPKYYFSDTVGSITNTTRLVSPVNLALSCAERYTDLIGDYPDLANKLTKAVGNALLGIGQTHKTVTRKEVSGLSDEFDQIREFFEKHKKPILDKFGSLEKWQIKLLARGTYAGIKKAHYASGFTKLCQKFGLYHPKWVTGLRWVKLPREMTPEQKDTLKQLQIVLVEILKEIDRICRANNIQYYLYGGTLLGAVRDGKIIPWDDDMDLVMYRKDYDRFLEVCKTQLKEQYALQTCFNDPGYPMLFAKIRKNGTFIREEKWDRQLLHNGIYVDILPLDNYYPKGKRAELGLQFMWFIHKICTGALEKSRNPLKTAIHHYINSKPIVYWYQKRESILRWFNRHIHGDWVCSFGSHYWPLNKRILKREWFGENVDIEFEDMFCMSPKDPEKYLTHLFGKDYMSPPPKKLRMNHADLENIVL